MPFPPLPAPRTPPSSAPLPRRAAVLEGRALLNRFLPEPERVPRRPALALSVSLCLPCPWRRGRGGSKSCQEVFTGQPSLSLLFLRGVKRGIGGRNPPLNNDSDLSAASRFGGKIAPGTHWPLPGQAAVEKGLHCWHCLFLTAAASSCRGQGTGGVGVGGANRGTPSEKLMPPLDITTWQSKCVPCVGLG